jgi:hypothetical protein
MSVHESFNHVSLLRLLDHATVKTAMGIEFYLLFPLCVGRSVRRSVGRATLRIASLKRVCAPMLR